MPNSTRTAYVSGEYSTGFRNSDSTPLWAFVTTVEVIRLRRLDFSPRFQTPAPVDPKPEPAKHAQPMVFEPRTYACPSDTMLERIRPSVRLLG